jgi:2,3-diaminopropionate biosynthesis protein SbnA
MRSPAAVARAEDVPWAGGILSAIGNTPLVALRKLLPDAGFALYGKLEGLNPAGSMKDRSAVRILLDALERGELGSDSVVIESSSGNFGIGLAQACRYLGVRLICVVDCKTTKQNVEILRIYGAEVDVVQRPDAAGGDLLQARLRRVRELLAAHENAFWPDQYANPISGVAHVQTVREIECQLGRLPDYLFCATGTCGTLRGCAEYVRSVHGSTRIVAVDAVGSAIFGHRPRRRLIPGHGAALRPALFEAWLADRVVHVDDRESVQGCRKLVRREAILGGGSSGAVVTAIERIAPDIEHGATCVAILPDRGDRYIDTIYSDEWVLANFARAEDART